jgi:hypothetical protein
LFRIFALTVAVLTAASAVFWIAQGLHQHNLEALAVTADLALLAISLYAMIFIEKRREQ